MFLPFVVILYLAIFSRADWHDWQDGGDGSDGDNDDAIDFTAAAFFGELAQCPQSCLLLMPNYTLCDTNACLCRTDHYSLGILDVLRCINATCTPSNSGVDPNGTTVQVAEQYCSSVQGYPEPPATFFAPSPTLSPLPSPTATPNGAVRIIAPLLTSFVMAFMAIAL